ncbi:MAG: UvrD-helicase domain-containing protein [candidate division Zixibacteria bacterium]|nr:UvrD-helicase domain-containing protein [candidate division Zixibacteria bacterium]
MDQILRKLNPVQKEAVITTEGPLLIIAGAGSGKTRVLTSRVAYILAQRLAEPYNILAVTFTNKAANEMKERITALFGHDIFSLTVSTFHSFCARLLRKESEAIGYPSNFTIFDEDDAVAMIRNCVDQVGLSRTQFTPASLRRKISAAKNRMEGAAVFEQKAIGYFEKRTAEIYTLYERRLKECGAFDFDDLIMRTVQLLEGKEEIRNKYQERFKYILVDEYQDTNHSQYKLLKFLIGPHRNICVVGDEDQSIYGWRGADISNILNFEEDFPGAKVIKMEQNYRSTEVILQAASSVIANNVTRKGKTLWTETKSGDPLRLFLTDSALDEAAAVIDEIEKNREKSSLKETVILYRTNAQSRAFEEVLRRRNLPYQIIGGISFYQRKEIKDLVAYLKLLANPRDDISFQRIINFPPRGIGETSVGKLAKFAGDRQESFYQACFEIEKCDELGERPCKLIKRFLDFMQPFMEKKKTYNIATLSQELVDELHLIEHFLSEDPILGETRVENIEEFIAAAGEFAAANEEPNLENFLAEISLYTDIDAYREIEDKLTLMTLHSAKGLEYDAVFLVGLEEGLFPLGRAIENPMELEEERRLFYVGATRARKNLFISMATARNRFGEMESIPSRFIKELPPALLEVVDRRSHHRNEYGTVRPVGSILKKETGQSSEPRYEYEEEEVLRAGRIVQHPTFGRGKVIRAEGSGEGLRLEVYFTGVGVKKIMAKYAKLKVVG